MHIQVSLYGNVDEVRNGRHLLLRPRIIQILQGMPSFGIGAWLESIHIRSRPFSHRIPDPRGQSRTTEDDDNWSQPRRQRFWRQRRFLVAADRPASASPHFIPPTPNRPMLKPNSKSSAAFFLFLTALRHGGRSVSGLLTMTKHFSVSKPLVLLRQNMACEKKKYGWISHQPSAAGGR